MPLINPQKVTFFLTLLKSTFVHLTNHSLCKVKEAALAFCIGKERHELVFDIQFKITHEILG